MGASIHGLSVRQFEVLVGIVAGRDGEHLALADRVLLTVVYYRTNLTFRQIALLFGISKSRRQPSRGLPRAAAGAGAGGACQVVVCGS